MVNLLEEIGAISRRNMYKIVRNPDCSEGSVCTVELDDNTVQRLSKDNFNHVVQAGLKACGYIDQQEIEKMFVSPCEIWKKYCRQEDPERFSWRFWLNFSISQKQWNFEKPGCIIQELYDISIRKNLDSDSIINIKTDYLYKYHTLRRKIQWLNLTVKKQESLQQR